MMFSEILKVFWSLKWIIAVVLLLLSNIWTCNTLSNDRKQYEQELLSKDLAYSKSLNEQQAKALKQYSEIQKSLSNIQENYNVLSQDITIVGNKLDTDVGRLSQTVNNTYTTIASESGDSKLASSLSVLSRLSTDCFGEYSKMATDARREQLAKQTLEKAWKEQQKLYNEESE